MLYHLGSDRKYKSHDATEKVKGERGKKWGREIKRENMWYMKKREQKNLIESSDSATHYRKSRRKNKNKKIVYIYRIVTVFGHFFTYTYTCICIYVQSMHNILNENRFIQSVSLGDDNFFVGFASVSYILSMQKYILEFGKNFFTLFFFSYTTICL